MTFGMFYFVPEVTLKKIKVPEIMESYRKLPKITGNFWKRPETASRPVFFAFLGTKDKRYSKVKATYATGHFKWAIEN